MKQKVRKILSLLLVFAMVLGMVPGMAFADTSPSVTTTNFKEDGDWKKVTITNEGDEANFIFTPEKSGTYIMYYQVNDGTKSFEVTTEASPSNAIFKTEYRNPKTNVTGYVLEMDPGDTYAIKLLGNGSGSCDVTVGAATPLRAENFDGFDGYYFRSGTVEGKLGTKIEAVISDDNQTLSLAFLLKSTKAYDENTKWTASSSNAEVISVSNRTEVIADQGSYDYAEYIGYAPVFDLHKAGEAEIKITAEYKERTVSVTYNVVVTESTGDDGGSSGPNGPSGPNSPSGPNGPSGPSNPPGTLADNEFTTIAEMEAAINKYSQEESMSVITCKTAGVFEISEEIMAIPKNIELDFGECDLVIPSGITLTTDGMITCNNLIVNGTMNAYGGADVYGNIEVNGTLVNGETINSMGNLVIGDEGKVKVRNGYINVVYNGNFTNYDQIEFVYEESKINFEKTVRDTKDLKSVLSKVETTNTTLDSDRFAYMIKTPQNKNGSAATFKFDQKITIPSNVELDFAQNCMYEVADGVIMTVDGSLVVRDVLTVKGTIVNNGEIRVRSLPDDGKGENGMIIIEAGGSVTIEENAILSVDASSSVKELNDILPWDNLDDYDVRTETRHNGRTAWYLTYVPEATQLGTPTDLEWGVYYNETGWEYDPITGDVASVELEKTERSGAMSWKTVLPDQAWIQMKLYRVGEDTPVGEWRTSHNPSYQPEYRSSDWFMTYSERFESGEYYFTVQSMADGNEYRNSEIATSGIYKYVKPEQRLETPTKPTWEERDVEFVNWAKWESDSSAEYRDGDMIEFYYCDVEDGDDYMLFASNRNRGLKKKEMPFTNFFLRTDGSGYYKFRICTLSTDIETYANSGWSEYSPAMKIEDLSEAVSAELAELLDLTKDQKLTSAEIRDALQGIDTNKLRAILLADMANEDVTRTLADLEAKAGGPALVNVKPDAGSFDPNEISIIGANLNKTEDASDDPITLVLDKPDKDHVIPERFDSAVSVKFSMTLTDIENPSELEIPVKITLPVPENINPEYFVIIHYHLDNEPEIVWPFVYEENGKLYADFVLTSFSDFVLAEEVQEGVGEGGEVQPDEGNQDSTVDDSSGDNTAETTKPKKAPAVEAALPEYVSYGQWTSAEGKWTFADSNGEVYKNKWAAVVNPYAKKEAGQSAFDWFFFDANGHMMTGWIFEGGRWYYLNPVSDGTQGRMMTGWQLIDDKWYYLNTVSDGTKGAMLADAWIDGYYVDANGVWDATKLSKSK